MGDGTTGRAKPIPEADVVVIGAGLSGLMAARVLARGGLEPVVLEARDRVGGRVVNASIGDGAIVEMGGQWVAPRDDLLRGLAREFGLELFPTYDRGAQLLEHSAGVGRFRGPIPPLRPHHVADLLVARTRLDRLARKVPPGTPWTAAQARRWDGMTLGSWLDRNVRSREGRLLLEAAISTIWAAQPEEVNLLQALSFIHAAGSFDALSATKGGELQDRVVGGSARLAEELAKELADRIVLETPVDQITDRGERGVEVRSGDRRVRARRVIVAVPPALAGRLRYEPALPLERDQALQRLPMSSVMKVAAVYERPFWRERGLSGRSISVRGPVTATLDNSPPDGRPGVLVGFVPGARVRELARLPEAERRAAVLDTLTRVFGAEAEHPIGYHEKNWTADPWTRGCYFGLAAPGSLTGPLRTLARPIGNIHWAGAETAFENYGGLDGALLAGRRAGREVLNALAPSAAEAVRDAG